ncbi:MAG TPA: prepilin-type N-terminal cleavage/methylation domain-containing protein [Patescibacteria group bacterium]|nr:prepilin-type N-terminal cleavage/methylation domain-containing protein [Patescibacteria group bacterium]
MKKGFTLIELLVVMAIIGVLVALGAGNFRTAQMRGRDTQRKSDLKNVSNALELYYSDYKKYPDDLDLTSGTAEFTDSKTIYFKTLPKDPSRNGSYRYVYRIVDVGPPATNQKYQLFAHLENTEDQDLNLDITIAGCGGTGPCNFAITSANTSPTE